MIERPPAHRIGSFGRVIGGLHTISVALLAAPRAVPYGGVFWRECVSMDAMRLGGICRGHALAILKRILARSDNAKMLRIAAQAVAASVIHLHPIGDFAPIENNGQTVSEMERSIHPECAIAMTIFPGDPRPAIANATASDLCGKSLKHCRQPLPPSLYSGHAMFGHWWPCCKPRSHADPHQAI